MEHKGGGLEEKLAVGIKVLLVLGGLFVSIDSGCDDGWHAYSDSCYRVYSWSEPIARGALEARLFCRQSSSDLVVITSQEEHQRVLNLFNMDGLNVTEAYIGLSDTQQENNFVWIDGSPLVYKNWRHNEPNNYAINGGENCASMRLLTPDSAVWIDVPCLYNPRGIQGVACEKPLQLQDNDISSVTFVVINERFLLGYELEGVHTRSRLLCAMKCVQTTACLSAMYTRVVTARGVNCILSNATRWEERDGFTMNGTLDGYGSAHWRYLEPQFARK